MILSTIATSPIHRINPDGSTSLLEYPEEGCTWSGTFKNGVDLDEGDYAPGIRYPPCQRWRACRNADVPC